MQSFHAAVAIVILLAFCPRAIADSYAPSRPQVFSSPSGKFLVRVEAADSVENARFYWKHTEFNVFSYNDKTESYDRVTKFDVEGHPLLLFINDAGTHIVTIDQHFGVGYGQIAAIYNFQGKRMAQWDLEGVFKVSPYDFRSFPRFVRSTSSIYWRGNAGWNYDQKSIWIAAPRGSLLNKNASHQANMNSYLIDLEKLEIKLVPPETEKAEQAGADQPATKPADKVPAKVQPSTPTPKDRPR